MDSGMLGAAGTSAPKGMSVLADLADRASADGTDGHWLLDPSRYGGVETCASTFGLTLDNFNRLPNIYDHYTPELRQWGPRLLRTELGSEHWALAEREARDRRSASLLLVSVPVEQLVAHLKSLIKLPQHDGSRLLFRFQDPIVLANVIPLLTRVQTRALLGPVSRWMVFDVCGELVAAVRTSGGEPSAESLMLTSVQMAKLDDRLLPATVIAQANEVDTTLLGGHNSCAQWRLIRQRIENGRRQGLNAHGDLSLYVILSLQLPDDFDRTGPVADALRRAAATGIGFRQAVEEVPVGEWRKWDEVLDAR